MRFEVKCVAVVRQGVDKILIETIDELSVAEEQSILNLSQSRGTMEAGKLYRVTIEEEHHGDGVVSITEPKD
jgi:hypothetical protein